MKLILLQILNLCYTLNLFFLRGGSISCSCDLMDDHQYLHLQYENPSHTVVKREAVTELDGVTTTRLPLNQISDGSSSLKTEFKPNDIIPTDYNKHLSPPTPNGTPTGVQMQVLIVNIRDIKELTEELTLELNVKMFWKDERLKHLANWAKDRNEPFLVLNPETVEGLWHPDVFIDHVKTVQRPAVISKPASLRIYQDCTVRYSARITLAQSCKMDFHYYPADTQRCPVDFMSFAFNSGKLNLTWNKGGNGATLASKLHLPSVEIGLDLPETFQIVTNSGKYIALRFVVLLRRKLSYHLLQTYLPSTLFVFVSWQSFLVPADSVPGRMALCMTTLLTLTSMFSSVRQSIPVVSYIKAIDVWMVSCIIFVFFTLLEFASVIKLKSISGASSSLNASSPKRSRGRIDRNCSASNKTGGKVSSNGIRKEHLQEMTSSFNTSQISTIPDQFESQRNVDTIALTSKIDRITSPNRKLATQQQQLQLQFVHPVEDEHVPDEHHDNLSSDELVNRIEKITSILIPSLFILFNLVYWPWLLYKANYYEQFHTTAYYSTS